MNNCEYCGMKYEQGGNNFCSKQCWMRSNAKKRMEWMKTHTAWEYFNQFREPTPSIKLNMEDAVTKNIRREYRNQPKTREMMLARRREELLLRQKELQGYKLT